MALKELLVYLDQSENALVRLHLAADLASRHACHVTALFSRDWSRLQTEEHKCAELGLASAADVLSMRQRVAGTIERARDQLRQTVTDLARAQGLRIDWREVHSLDRATVLEQSRYADLCVLSHDGAIDVPGMEYAGSEELLFVSGRPVVLVPGTCAGLASLGRHIAIAWNSSGAATRALHDALPLIERADSTTVLTVTEAAQGKRHGAAELPRLVEYLKMHGAGIDAVTIAAPSAPAIADSLQSEALERGADLLVAGAFGHARLREKFLGGVTYDLLARLRMPVLMSH